MLSFWRQCRLAAHGGDHLQPLERAKASCVASRLADSAPEADAIPNLPHGWKNRQSRTANGGEAKPRHRSVSRLVARTAPTAFASRDVARPRKIGLNLSSPIAATADVRQRIDSFVSKTAWKRHCSDVRLHESSSLDPPSVQPTLSQPISTPFHPYVRITATSDFCYHLLCPAKFWVSYLRATPRLDSLEKLSPVSAPKPCWNTFTSGFPWRGIFPAS